jgi:N-methylhydantoinase A/oxoprolinase/acetone carboxylase beta subunit
MPKQRLSLSWGSSFAESQKGPDWTRVYTPIQPVPALLKNLAGGEAVDLRLSLTVMRRILDTRLGNSVAQIVTQGFEQWVLLRQEPDPGHFDLSPVRREPLANPENLYGLSERMSSTGEVLQKLDLKDLEKISAELKKKNIERVCVNLLFANRNPLHQQQTESFLREKGFQVFSKVRGSGTRDELSAWRRNLLDASLSSFFEKIRSELDEALPGSDIRFLDTEKGFVTASEVSTSGLLFGREKTLQQKKPLIYLGAEEWVWIRP